MLLVYFSEDTSGARSIHSQATSLGKDGYTKILEVTMMTDVSQIECQAKCMLTFGCLFYNYNQRLSACHFADPLGGSLTVKPENLADWHIYKMEELTVNDQDKF